LYSHYMYLFLTITGAAKKDRGNFWYKRDDASTAIHCYRRAVEFLDTTEEEMQLLNDESKTAAVINDFTDDQKKELQSVKDKIREIIDLRKTAFNNLAAAQLKTEAFDAALKSIDNVLQLDTDNVKALYRKSKILKEKGETEAAQLVLKKALKLDPTSRVIQNDLKQLEAKRVVELKKERSMYQRMLQTSPEKEQAAREKVARKQTLNKWVLIAGSIAVAAASAVAFAMYGYS